MTGFLDVYVVTEEKDNKIMKCMLCNVQSNHLILSCHDMCATFYTTQRWFMEDKVWFEFCAEIMQTLCLSQQYGLRS